MHIIQNIFSHFHVHPSFTLEINIIAVIFPLLVMSKTLLRNVTLKVVFREYLKYYTCTQTRVKSEVCSNFNIFTAAIVLPLNLSKGVKYGLRKTLFIRSSTNYTRYIISFSFATCTVPSTHTWNFLKIHSLLRISELQVTLHVEVVGCRI